MTTTRGQRLRDARAKRFKSARSAALALGLPISSYGAHERAEDPGGRDFGPDEARRYARYFGVTPEWLLTGYDAHAGACPADALPNRLSIVGYVGAKGAVHLYEVKPDQFEFVDVHVPVNDSTAALEIRDRAVLGLIPKNWIVVFDRAERKPSREFIGKLCIVAREGNRIVLEMLRSSEKAVRWAAPIRAILPR
jgi:hypothetical protein